VKSSALIYWRLKSLYWSDEYWGMSRRKRYRLIRGLMKEIQ
jgi:hypothetical protein